MTKAPYMKFWVTDYLGDAGHLSTIEHGAYLRLLIEAWKTSTCSLPADAAWIKRRLRISDEEFEQVFRPVIAEFWTEEDHRIFQKRQRKEFINMIHLSEQGKMAANKRHHGRKVIPLKIKDE